MSMLSADTNADWRLHGRSHGRLCRALSSSLAELLRSLVSVAQETRPAREPQVNLSTVCFPMFLQLFVGLDGTHLCTSTPFLSHGHLLTTVWGWRGPGVHQVSDALFDMLPRCCYLHTHVTFRLSLIVHNVAIAFTTW